MGSSGMSVAGRWQQACRPPESAMTGNLNVPDRTWKPNEPPLKTSIYRKGVALSSCVRQEWSRTAVGWPAIRGGGNLYASWNRISKAGQHTDHQPTIAEEREGRAMETA
jgi:hypothetical protein